jgi:hypothetical protein
LGGLEEYKLEPTLMQSMLSPKGVVSLGVACANVPASRSRSTVMILEAGLVLKKYFFQSVLATNINAMANSIQQMVLLCLLKSVLGGFGLATSIGLQFHDVWLQKKIIEQGEPSEPNQRLSVLPKNKHLPHEKQFLEDFNLVGLAWIQLVARPSATFDGCSGPH